MIYGYTPTHPGEVLKDEIEARGMQQKVLAESMGMSYKVRRLRLSMYLT